MTLIVGNVMDVGLGPLDGTLRVWAGFRPEEVGLIAPVRRTWNVKAGQLPVDVDVTPGPAMVQFNFGMDATGEFPVVVPDVAQVTIQDLLLLHFAVDPFPVQEVMRDRLAAEAAAAEADSSATQAAADALTLAQRVDTGTRQVSWTSDGRPYLDKTATVGVPLRVDTTAGTRVSLGDVMIHGDTGVRDVFPLMTPDFTLWSSSSGIPDAPSSNTFLRMQRVGDRVHLWGRIAAAPELDGLPRSAERAMVETPHGFKPDRNFILVGQWAAFSDDDRGIMRARGNDLTLRDGAGRWRGGELIYLNATWRTVNDWPTSLPGVPG